MEDEIETNLNYLRHQEQEGNDKAKGSNHANELSELFIQVIFYDVQHYPVYLLFASRTWKSSKSR